MTQKEIFTLAIAAFFVLLILSIIFASKNKRLMKQVKLNTKKQDLVAKHYPIIDVALRFGFIAPIIFGNTLALQTYGKTGGLVVMVLAFLAIAFVVMAHSFLHKKAIQREAEGDGGFKVRAKLIKTHYPSDYNTYTFIQICCGSFLGIYLYDFGIYQAITFGSLILLLLTPLDHWVHNKLFEKSKLKEQAAD
tara:strand:+ start:9 stop:584 length:576 start_codon:yes stop_codon:yes gene_type:complete